LFDEIATDLNRKTSNDEDETVYANWSFMQDLALNGATTVTGTLDLEVGSAVNISGEANMFTDLRFDIAGNGIILRSPNNTEFKVTVGNDGALITTALGN
jgi:putative aminopeptidase FrvX